MRSNHVNMDPERATESVRIKRVELCCSRIYPYATPPPPPSTHTHTHGRQWKFRGEEGGPKGRNFRGCGGGSGFSRFFSVSPSKSGALSKTNSRTAEQALSHFTVDDLLKQELLFSSTIFY